MLYLGLAAALFLIAHFGIYLFQKYILFQPLPLGKRYRFHFNQPFEEHFIQVDEHAELNALYFPSTGGPSRGLILYFHGNADNLHRWGKYAVRLTDLGYDVLMPDYRLYGKSRGKLSEQAFYDDAEKVFHWGMAEFRPERVIFYGRSLGSAVASSLATRHEPELLILETPFDNITSAFRKRLPFMWLPVEFRFKFPNDRFLCDIRCKVVVYHGTWDELVPLRSAVGLKPLLKPEDEFVVIKRGRHGNLYRFSLFREHLARTLGDTPD